MIVVGYLLCNRFGEVLYIQRDVEEKVARELHEQGWRVYRQVAAG